jgi:hypothetical protein
MANFSITPDEVLKARGATFLSDLDMVISPNGGHLVPVAMNHGVHVCWGCGEPFGGMRDRNRMVEMRPPGSVVPVGMHSGCVGRRPRVSVADTLRGFELRRKMAQVAKPMIEIEKRIAAELGYQSVFGGAEPAATPPAAPATESTKPEN